MLSFLLLLSLAAPQEIIEDCKFFESQPDPPTPNFVFSVDDTVGLPMAPGECCSGAENVQIQFNTLESGTWHYEVVCNDETVIRGSVTIVNTGITVEVPIEIECEDFCTVTIKNMFGVKVAVYFFGCSNHPCG